MNALKAAVKSLLDKTDFALVRKEDIEPLDLRDKVNHPLSAKYIAGKRRFLIDTDFDRCVIMWKFSCEKKGNNPHVRIVKEYLEKGSVSYKGSDLEKFYNSFAPKNVAEMFELDGELHPNLTSLPATWVVLPWEDATMEKRKKHREKYLISETKMRGNQLDMTHGTGFIGPTSRERGELEITTLINLTYSIKENGYQRGGGYNEDILASVLIDGQDYTYMITNGNHRTSIMSALGFDKVTIRVIPSKIPAFIHKNEVGYWPNVRSGLYTINQALKIFDTVFQGDGVY